MIPYGRQLVEADDIDAVTAVLRGDWLTGGPAIEDFERAVCEHTGASHAVAFANGTAALHGALSVAGIGPGDRVVTSPLSFVASANCARYVGASADFVDIDPKTLNLDPAAVGPCDALVAVHYAGLPVDLSALTTRPRVIVEDAAHALGASTPDGPVGNCARSDMCTFSFHPVKAVTTGEGGAVTTNSDDLAEALRRFRSHGTVRRPDLGGWYYDVETLGFNYRLTDMQAALGTSQLRKLERFVERRNELAERYREILASVPIDLPPAAPPGVRHAYHLFAVQVPQRRAVYDAMQAANIGVQVHYVPIYKHPLYADTGRTGADFPETERAYDGLLSLPLFPALTDRDQDRVVDVLSRCLA
ncbi:MAG TPA: UDP-4-amino-4,6-dideoxy-N-acetyl-beta-L-altrosamine transaminase [Acidimicrobiia bacterium]|nr:UDP-4-amino-4,6-dideoxy-N-acetyl-beta-L-altrosamine transaminase [Acidimicrobiia bacterium]